MFYAVVGLFALSAVVGLVLAVKHLKGETVSIPAALFHGAAGAAGLVLYILAALRAGITPLTGLSLGLFVAAALGGFVLFTFHVKGRPLPKALLAVHALAAVSAFLMLLSFVFMPH